MLPAEQRLRRRSDFTHVVKHGARASRPLLTVHVTLPALSASTAPTAVPGGAADAALYARSAASSYAPPARAGLVVSKAVGGAVVRHRTARRLRHLLRPQLAALPGGALVVVRAAPPAGSATSAQLAGELDSALRRAVHTARRPREARGAGAGPAAR